MVTIMGTGAFSMTSIADPGIKYLIVKLNDHMKITGNSAVLEG